MPKTKEHDIKLVTQTEEFGLMLKGGPRGIHELPVVPTTSLFSRAGGKFGDYEAAFTHIEQRTWEGGRGLLNLVDDPTRFYDSNNLWSLTPGKIAPAPAMAFASGIRSVGFDSGLSGDTEYIKADRNEHGVRQSRLAWKFEMTTTSTPTSIQLYVGRQSAIFASASDYDLAIFTDSTGDPGTKVSDMEYRYGTSPENYSETPELHEWEFETPAELTSGTDYWVVLESGTPAGGSLPMQGTGLLFGIDASGSGAKMDLYTGGWTSWTAGGQLRFRLLTGPPDRKFHYFSFEGALYAVDVQDDGTAAQLYMNGDRGEATGGTSTTLVDTNDGQDGTWAADQWNGYWIKIVTGTGKGQAREITATTAAGTITVSPAWDITPLNDDSSYVIYEGPAWQEIGSHGLTAPASDVTVSNDQVIFTQGTSAAIRYMDYDHAAHAHAFRVDGNTQKADFVLATQDPNYGAAVWIATIAGSTIQRGDAVDYGSDLTLGSAIDVGGEHDPITNLIEYDGRLMVMKQGSAFTVENDKPSKLKVNLDGLPMATNGIAVAVQNLFLFFSWAYSVERYFNGTLDDVGPWKDEGLPANRQGYISALAPAFGWMFTAIDAGRSNTSNLSSVLLHNGMGYHEIYRGWAGARIRNLYFQGNQDTNPYLWVSIGGDMVYIKFPRYTIDPLKETNFECAPSGELISPIIDLGSASLPKYFKDITIHSENLNSGTYVKIDYQFDDNIGSTTWYGADAVFVSPESVAKLEIGNIRKLRYRLQLVTADVSNIPIVTAVVVKAFARTPVKYQWNIRAISSSVQRTYKGKKDHDPNNLINFLKESSQSTEKVHVTSRWPQLNDMSVVIEPPTILRTFTKDTKEGAVIDFTIRDA